MPAIHEDRVVFVSEDDLWEVPRQGGRAIRLTSGQGAVSWPSFSPDGEWIALVSQEEGAPDVYVMPSLGGPLRRLTFDASRAHVIGWNASGTAIRFASTRRSAHRHMHLFEVSLDGGQPRALDVGEGEWFSEQSDGPGRVLGRHRHDLARWKRYRGGLAGELWCDATHEHSWTRLLADEPAGLIRPMWLGDRIYFVGDQQGHGNIYSCTPDGTEITRHTDHVGFFVRATQSDGRRIVYGCGGDLYTLDLLTHTVEQISVQMYSPCTQMRRKFVDAVDDLTDYTLHPEGHHLCVVSRGKPFHFGLWEGGVKQIGQSQGVRYRLAEYLSDGSGLIVISDEGVTTGYEHLEVHDVSGEGKVPRRVVLPEGETLGRAVWMTVCPVGSRVAIGNNRQELWIVDLEDPTQTWRVDRSPFGRFDTAQWSPDGRWLTYARSAGEQHSMIMLCDVQERTSHQLTSGEFRDTLPTFDPEGRYLYFASYRTFNPIYGNLFFELGLTQGMRLCLMTLKADTHSPFVEKPRPLDDDGEDDRGSDDAEQDVKESEDETSSTEERAPQEQQEGSEGDDENTPEPVEIDLDGLGSRVVMFPIGERIIHDIEATADRVYLISSEPSGSLDAGPSSDEDDETSGARLEYWSFEDRKLKHFHEHTQSFALSLDHKTLALWSKRQLRVVSASGSEPDMDEEAMTRKTGWINLDRLSIEVDPRQEWRQMFGETWRLMRDDFWREDMSGVDWEGVYARYAPLVERVNSRGEFSDLIWTMQGELGTSHAYEFGGDYRPMPFYPVGALGVELLWDAKTPRGPGEGNPQGAYRISHIVQGDDWDPGRGSPLRRPGVGVKEGDLILAVDGQPLDASHGLDERLVNRAGVEVDLVLYTPGDESTRAVTVRTLSSHAGLYYREWVNTRRALVHERSQGRVGYVHVPDMGPHGYAEFHRGYAAERGRDALIVDVRYNGGGHVSSLILDKLRRAPLGFDLSRYDARPMAYPQDGPSGPVVALTNEYAGSDGDIFSHGFKMLGLGPLLGKRTWGGVIGIWPRHALVDGSVTTQPSFSFWFHDVGFGVENHGAEPDTEILDPPEAQADGDDVQLDAAINEALRLIEERPSPRPASFEPFPNMRPPDKLD